MFNDDDVGSTEDDVREILDAICELWTNDLQ